MSKFKALFHKADEAIARVENSEGFNIALEASAVAIGAALIVPLMPPELAHEIINDTNPVVLEQRVDDFRQMEGSMFGSMLGGLTNQEIIQNGSPSSESNHANQVPTYHYQPTHIS